VLIDRAAEDFQMMIHDDLKGRTDLAVHGRLNGSASEIRSTPR
jgi:hypothetical protein